MKLTVTTRYWKKLSLLGCGLLFGIASCTQTTSDVSETSEAAIPEGEGTLVLEANGESFVQEGFTTKDGWDIRFDHLYVTFGQLTAFQSEPPFEPGDETLQAKESLALGEATTVDLTTGDGPVEVASISDAPSGRYNALDWQLAEAEDGAAKGYPLMMIGEASKDGETVNFQVALSDTLGFACGDFVGDERKGILQPGETADVEATFHFDHFFGDAELEADDPLNAGALGFDPLAALAEDGQLTIDSEGLEAQLPAEDYDTLQALLPSLGHVGEGHCANY